MDEAKLEKVLSALGITLSEFNELTDELITDKQILEIKRTLSVTGGKPPLVSNSRWAEVFEITPLYNKMIMLAAMGKRPNVIAEELDLSAVRIARLLNSPYVKQKVAAKQDSLFEGGAKMHMKVLINKAFGVFEEILENADEKSSVRLEAAKYVIDHVKGKAVQTHEVRGSLLADLITKIDNEKIVHEIRETPEEPEYVDVSVNEAEVVEDSATALKLLAPVRDDMDTLVDSLISNKGFVVGKREGS